MNDGRTVSPQLGTTALRIGLGILFLVHGLTKIFVFTIPGTMGFFESVGFPGILAIPVIVAEVGGGALLLVGFGTRWAALALVPVMLGATSVHWGNGFTFSNSGGGWEFTAFLAVVSLALFLYGDDGRLSVGAFLRDRRSAASAPRDIRSAA